ncbi:MAG: sigma 54-interacting transcriptional regulator [Desulfobacterales bacterium]|jgi:transcriptional regulator with GAF, ATPase, and Fis domain
MRWSTEIRYKMLLEINNAIVSRTTREDLFRALARELRRHFAYDRMCIILYDADSDSISYFAAADGIQPDGNLDRETRPLANGAIARMVIQSGQPVVFDDLRRYRDLSSVGALVRAGLNASMAFPLIIRDRVLGSIHLSFQKAPKAMSELTEVLKAVSQQVAIAVENMLAYTELKQSNANLEMEKRFLMECSEEYQQADFFFASPQMARIMEMVASAAETDETVLITGETGTGKDYLARRIHTLSPRGDRLFVKTNCPALASSLFESELFGHAKGAFTGADHQRLGRFELANGGTIFLDEVGDLPIALQAKLLHVLQDRRLERVGDSRSISIDARVIAATNRNLLESVRKNQFRQDLYYRLNIIHIPVPPLRERIEDIRLLVLRLTQAEARRTHREEPLYSETALDRLETYGWPGNVRELKNFVKRMLIQRPGKTITPDEIDKLIELSEDPSAYRPKKVESLQAVERRHIVRALQHAKGRVGGVEGAAQLVGLPRSTFQYRLKKFGIDPKQYA